MKRKLIKQGNGALTVSLPKEWTQSKNISAGDEIEMYEEKGDLKISSHKKLIENTYSLSITSENKHHLKHYLTHIYRLGFEKISISFDNESSISEIENITHLELFGFEVMKKNKNKVVLESMFDSDNQKYVTIMKKVFLSLQEMASLLETIHQEKREDVLQNLHNLFRKNDRNIFFAKRLLSIHERNPEIRVLDWELLKGLLEVGHYIYYCAEKMSTQKNQLLYSTTLSIKHYILELSQFYFNLNEEKYYYFLDIKKIYFGENLDALETIEPQYRTSLSLMNSILRRIQLAASPIYAKYLLLKRDH